MVLLWYPIGVMKLADAANMMVIRKGVALMPKLLAVAIAIGARSAAAA